MTNKNVTLNLSHRHLAIVKTAIGDFGSGVVDAIRAGHEVTLDGVDLKVEEFRDLIEVIKSAEADAGATPNVLTNREKFLLGGALGALFAQMDASVKGPRGAQLVSDLKQEILEVGNKLDLRAGAIAGALDFLAEQE